MRTVVLAEDDPLLRDVLMVQLEKASFKVIACRDGVEALHAATTTVPAVILADIDMPNMTGIELAMALQDHPSTQNVPIVVLSAQANRVTNRILGQTTIVRVVQKPFSSASLIAAVLEVLDDDDGRPALSA